MPHHPVSSQPATPGTWASHWTKLKEKHLMSVNIHHEGDFWLDPDNVRRYLENTKGSYGKVVDEQLRTMIIPPGGRVLDIGAGAGTLAVPLAKRGCDVTVVEQSPLMCAALDEFRISEGTRPVTIITRRWEEVAPQDLNGPFDLIIASYSLTMTDIVGTIRSIQEVSAGMVYLFWFLTPPSWATVMEELWPSLHQKPYFYSPLANCLWNALYEMGIYAHIEVMDPAPPRTYDSIEQAVNYMTRRLECTEEWQKAMVRSYYAEKLHPAPDGRYLCEEGHRSAKIWWDNTRPSSRSSE